MHTCKTIVLLMHVLAHTKMIVLRIMRVIDERMCGTCRRTRPRRERAC